MAQTYSTTSATVAAVPAARSRMTSSVPGSFFFSFGFFAAPGSGFASGLASGLASGFASVFFSGASSRYATNLPDSSATLKLLTRSAVNTWPVARFSTPTPPLGCSSGFFFSFFALSTSALTGAMVNTTNLSSAVITGSRPRA